MLGDYHTIELCFVWGNQWPPILHGFYKPESKELSDAMGHYWTNMAAVGQYVGTASVMQCSLMRNLVSHIHLVLFLLSWQPQ